MKQFLSFILILFVAQASWAQNNISYGLFKIVNFAGTQYNGHDQNWDIIQGSNKFIYIANNGSILEFDGLNWNKTQLDNRETVYALAKKNTGEIYAGGKNEFGTIYHDDKGKLSYQKISQPFDTLNFENIIAIECLNKDVYFFTKKYIFLLTEDGNVSLFDQTNDAEYAGICSNSKKIIYLKKYINGNNPNEFLLIKDKSIHPINKKTEVGFKPVFLNENNLIISSTGKTYTLDNSNNVYTIKDNFVYNLEFNETVDINDVAQSGKLIAVSNSGKGVSIFDSRGKFIRKFGIKDGLINLQIRKVYFDNYYNLWLANDNGITFIEMSSSVTSLNTSKGITSAIEDIYFKENQILLATRSDLFSSKIEKNNLNFKNTGIFDMELFQIKEFTFTDQTKHLLLIGNDGIYKLNNDKTEKISDFYAWDMVQSPENPNHIYFGLDGDGVGILKYEKGKFIEEEFIENTEGDVRKIRFFNGNLYYTVKNIGLIKYTNGKSLEESIVPGLNLNTKDSTSIFKQFTAEIFQEKLFLGTSNGLYYLDNTNLKPYTDLNEYFIQEKLYIHRIFNDDNKKLWLVLFHDSDTKDEYSEIGYIDFSKGNVEWVSHRFKEITEDRISAIKKDENGIYWFGGGKNLYTYNSNSKYALEQDFDVYISQVHFNNEDTTYSYYSHLSKNEKNIFTFDQNTIILKFNSSSYTGEFDNYYSYYLEGLDDSWGKWTKETKKEYPRLHEGTYTFHVKALNYYGYESKETCFVFTILPPWYRTWWAYLIYFALVIFGIYVIIKLSVRRVKLQNEKLEQIVEERTAEIEEQNKVLEIQKHEIEEINKDIVDSIKYAKRIQNTILPTDDRLNTILKEHFVIYIPKDIVSGDFYWADQLDGKTYISAIDCTGHGVPGAFVSIVGFNGLKRTVNEFNIRKPSLILDKLTDIVVETFSQSESHLKDGMDLNLCTIDYDNLKLEYAGANNPLVIIRNNEIIEISANKQPIGDFEYRVPFTNHEVQLQKGDSVYLFTDGYADQFGGPKGKKFKLKSLKDLFIQVANLPVEEQKEKILHVFNQWKGDSEQLDDVCLIGLKF